MQRELKVKVNSLILNPKKDSVIDILFILVANRIIKNSYEEIVVAMQNECWFA